MKKICIYLLLLVSTSSFAQVNLVPNPSFEDFDSCPDFLSQIDRAIGWNGARNTPDYFNTCSSNLYSGVPLNYFGYRTPASGNAYAGIIVKDSRELLETQLLSPLQIGSLYYLSFKISLAGQANNNYCGINKLGALFTTSFYHTTNMDSLCNCPQIYSDSIVTDTLNWTRLMGSFTADSNYSFVTIGNLFRNYFNDTIQVGGIGCNTYYYIDDICLSTDSLFVTNYTYSGMEEQIDYDPIICYPNPVKDILIIKSINLQLNKVVITDLAGRTVLSTKLENQVLSKINLFNLKSGAYFIALYKNNSISKIQKFIKL